MNDMRNGNGLLCCEAIHPSRRAVLGTAGALFAWSFAPKMLRAAGNRDTRFVCIVLRGALDGLAAVAPLGDPDYERQRRNLALHAGGDHPAIPLDGFFALHPAMPNIAKLFRAGQVAIVHAASTGYHRRSHFDGQDVLESGYPEPGHAASGWMNRFLAAMPAGERISARGALGVGIVPPLIVRGQAPVVGWAPTASVAAGDDLADRVLDLYGERDKELLAALARGLDADKLAAGETLSVDRRGAAASNPEGMKLLAEGTARLIARDDGPRIAALALEGWDTHANEGGATGQLAQRLGGLDSAISAFERVLGEKWRDTVLLVVTEFGRTVAVNGSAGTDHGVGTVALLCGGAVRGGRVIADWPGLASPKLFQGRDLAPTVDVRSVVKGLMSELYGLSPQVLSETVFPGSGGIQPMKGLIV